MSRFFSDSISAKSYIYFEVFWLIKHWFYYGWIILLGNHWKTRFVSLKSVLIWPSEVPNLFWKYQKSNVSDFSNRYWCPYFFLNPSDEKVSAIWSVVHVWPGFGNQKKNVLIYIIIYNFVGMESRKSKNCRYGIPNFQIF